MEFYTNNYYYVGKKLRKIKDIIDTRKCTVIKSSTDVCTCNSKHTRQELDDNNPYKHKAETTLQFGVERLITMK